MEEPKPDWLPKKPSVNRKQIFRRMKGAERASTRHAHEFIVKRIDTIRIARRHIAQWLVLVSLLIASTGLQLSWAQSSYQTTGPAQGGTYAEALVGAIDTLNPLYATSDAELAASKLLFSSLYSFDTAGKLSKNLAESLEIDESGKVYTVEMHPNAYWHDGTPVTAHDVAFTISLIKKPAAMSQLRINWQDVEVRAVDDTTVEFRLPALYAAFPHAMTFSILPAHILGDIPAGAIRENTFSRYPVGSGPFVFRNMQTAGGQDGYKIIQTTSFDRYFRGQPNINRMEIHAHRSQEKVVEALKAGSVNAASGVPLKDLEQLSRSGYSVSAHPVNSGVYGLMNTTNLILKDKTVRRAFQIGTDTKALRDLLPIAVPKLDLPFVNGQITGESIPTAPQYSKEQAAEMLDQAGWKMVNGVREKEGQKLTISVTTTKNDNYEKIAEGLAAQWRGLGADVRVNIVDPSVPGFNFVQSILQPRNFDVLVYELLIGADPDVYAYWHSSQVGSTGYNFSNYSNATSDAALVSARSVLNPSLRNSKYRTFSELWISDAPAIGLYQPVVAYARIKSIRSVEDSMPFVTPADHYANILDWSVRERTVYKTP